MNMINEEIRRGRRLISTPGVTTDGYLAYLVIIHELLISLLTIPFTPTLLFSPLLFSPQLSLTNPTYLAG